MPKVPQEVTRENYLLKSTFFYNKLQKDGYFELFMQVQNLCRLEGDKLSWAKHEEWSISKTAWEALKSSEIAPMLVFAHPKILQLNPSFLRYYRSVAMIPQKGFKAITGINNIERIETGKVEAGKLNSAIINKLVSAINEVISLVITLSADISENEIKGMMYATAGSSIEGSWRNAIGSEGERVIRSIILRELLKQKDISSICDRNNKTRSISEFKEYELLDSIENIRTIYLKNGFSMIFSSEPDVTLHDDNGAIVGVIEIKAGLDPAGALERLGAMLKSFENVLAEYPRAVTILVASCITDEVDTRLSASMSVRQKYITANITSNESSQRKFANSVRKILKLT